MPEISIIVPVFKVEKYIDKCIQSILSQAFSDFELILIDDGSPDRSGNICDEYAKKDARIRVIHQDNQGVSSARNAGLDIAQGSYIGFVDPDDYIEENMYEFLHNLIIHNNADISICGVFHCYNNNIRKSPKNVMECVLSAEEGLELILYGREVSVTVFDKLFKASLLKSVRFPTDISYAEDAYFTIEVFCESSLIAINTVPKYNYVHRSNSATTKGFHQKDYQVIKVYEKIQHKIKQEFPKLIPVTESRLFWAHRRILERIAIDTSVNRRNYYNDVEIMARFLRSNMLAIFKSPYFSIKKKIEYMLIFINPYLFMYLFRIKYKYRFIDLN